MELKACDAYLVGERIMGFTYEGRVVPLQEEERIKNLSMKERALRFNGFVITDKQGNIIFEDRKRYSQHFFPLSILDYVKAMYNWERDNKPIPILSVDSHDVLQCDFRCQDCLSAHGTNFPRNHFPKDNFDMDLKTYKRILKEIVDYSKRRGFSGVRFEQSGEGNPDCYRYRPEILECAHELGMQSVYVSTGSKIGENLRRSLVENSSFIRISFPGIGDAYSFYSGQSRFSFTDALNGLERIISERDKKGRKRDLMVGARVALRSEHSDTYFNFAKRLKNLGVDSLQIVKLLVPEGRNPSDFPLSLKDIHDLKETATLEDPNFNVTIPHGLDFMVYSREIENRDEFPTKCFSARFQPVLAGRTLFVCTISDIMYSHNLRLGTFATDDGDLENFLSSENLERVTNGIPSRCRSCSNIYDNLVLFTLQNLFRANTQELDFYEVIV
jgi:hypothetical protein